MDTVLVSTSATPAGVPSHTWRPTARKASSCGKEESTMLALTDESANSQALQPELTPSAESLAQGLEQVQMYEEQQRQDLAAEQDAEVIEPEQALVHEVVTDVATDVAAQVEVIEAQAVVQEEVKPA